MPYATKASMIARFGESEVIALTDREGLGAVDDVVLDGALAEADAEIDPYLVPKYSMPLSNVPRILSGFACDITRYRLCGSGVNETEEVRKRYEDAIKFLVKVSRGEIGLGLDAVGTTPVAQGSVKVYAPDRVFDSNSLNGF